MCIENKLKQFKVFFFRSQHFIVISMVYIRIMGIYLSTRRIVEVATIFAGYCQRLHLIASFSLMLLHWISPATPCTHTHTSSLPIPLSIISLCHFHFHFACCSTSIAIAFLPMRFMHILWFFIASA